MTLTACSSSEKSGENPLLGEWETPFGVPPFDEITPEHFMPAFERGMSLHEAEIDAITSNNDAPTFENVILALDNAGESLSRTALVFGMLCAAETNDQMQAIQEQAMPMLAAHSDKIRLNEKLFEKVKAVYDHRETLGLDSLQSRLLKKSYDGFVRAGALLQGADRERLKQINAELSVAGVKFGNNLLAENNAFQLELTEEELEGLPTGVRDAAKTKAKELGKNDKWVFTLQKPSLLPFLTYSTKRDLREKLYNGYLSRGANGNESDNKKLINDFIRLRAEKAKLLGYPNYASYVIADQMAGKPERVYALLDEIWTPALKRAEGELAQMDSLFVQDVPGGKFESWDWWYYAEKLRVKNYALEEEMLRPYFALSNVQTGIFFLANRLYGVTFRPITAPVYHSEASAFEVLDADESHLGVLYFDFHPRAGKGQGAWCGNYVDQTYKDGKRVAPVVSIVCNFTRSSSSTPALLTLDETETLFHEFGHALHFLFQDVKYRGLASVEGDFVELPSQIMENWAFQPEMLRHYATHYRTNEVIPDYLIEKISRSALFNQGFTTTELIAAAYSDLDIHSTTEYQEFDPATYEHQVLNEKRGLIQQIEPRYRYPYFSHIFDGGYSAGYYFYTWAEVLDKDAFEAFEETGDLFNRKVASAFRKEILSRGGSLDGMSLYRAFRGQEPDKTAMLVGRGLMERPVVAEEAPASETPADVTPAAGGAVSPK